MSTLADRLAAASRDRTNATVVTSDAMVNGPERRGGRDTTKDAFRELKSQVHTRLLQQLGPKLYDAELTQAELERMVRAALQEAMQDEEILITNSERTRIAQE